MTIAAQHAVRPEDIMAFIDGELSAAEACTIAAHLEECAECADIADQFRTTALALDAWTVRAAPETLDAAIYEKAKQTASRRAAKPPAHTQLGAAPWRRWAIGGGCAIMVLFLFAMFQSQRRYAGMIHPRQVTQDAAINAFALRDPHPTAMTAAPSPSSPAEDTSQRTTASAHSLAKTANATVAANSSSAVSYNPSAPMISRTVSLTILVKDISQARPALDAILARYQGYAAQLNIHTPENDARSFGASLRIPAPALSAALAELRSLGRVQIESQFGEEVTEQHADLVARLKNARETEQRLLAILQQRTGKVEEILEVEEQISSTRGEIERMEAEQKALEHRVDFATVQLQLTEEYKAQLAPTSTSVGTRMHNAFVTGLGNAGSSMLGMLLFFEEYGPVLLVWFTILGSPAWFLWRYYRRALSRI